MRINKGVEWAAHACTLLVPLWPDHGLSLSALAKFHDLPEAFMAKQMQALASAGILKGGRGRNGFYTLAISPASVTLLDILLAVDGDKAMFQCTEIRQQGPCGSNPKDCKLPCNIAAGFAQAEDAYRDSLSRIDLETLTKSVTKQLGTEKTAKAGEWIYKNIRSRS